jgi:hypothetical protein
VVGHEDGERTDSAVNARPLGWFPEGSQLA